MVLEFFEVQIVLCELCLQFTGWPKSPFLLITRFIKSFRSPDLKDNARDGNIVTDGFIFIFKHIDTKTSLQ